LNLYKGRVSQVRDGMWHRASEVNNDGENEKERTFHRQRPSGFS
jgi:hypothetical protein